MTAQVSIVIAQEFVSLSIRINHIILQQLEVRALKQNKHTPLMFKLCLPK